jgi:fucose permease
MRDSGQPPETEPSARLEVTLLYGIFAATGIGMALPGAVLPALMRQWALRDSGAGLLLFLAWMGSSTGALAAGRHRRAVVSTGCAAVALSLTSIAFGPASLRFAGMVLYGLGLGGAMTATSLMQAARHPRDCAREMNRLNMIWAVGAVSCPSLAAHSLRVASVRYICATLAATFLLLSAMLALTALRSPHPLPAPLAVTPLQKRIGNPLLLWPIPLLLLAFLPTGIESTMGGWVAEYARREHRSIATAVLAGSLFWGGVLTSRALGASRFLRWRTERGLLLQSAWTIFFGVLLLVVLPDRTGILFGNALVGFGLGPVYPLALALALRHREHPSIFWIAGLGSASLPWLTGLASTATGSLRLGLLVPLAATLLLLCSGLLARTDLPAAVQETRRL